MKYLVKVEIPIEAASKEEAADHCRKALVSRGFAGFDILEARSEWDPSNPDNCPECGAPPGDCDPRCGEVDDDIDF